MRDFLAHVARSLDVWDVLALAGLASITTGLAMLWPPAALLFVGVVLVAAAVISTRPPGPWFRPKDGDGPPRISPVE